MSKPIDEHSYFHKWSQLFLTSQTKTQAFYFSEFLSSFTLVRDGRILLLLLQPLPFSAQRLALKPNQPRQRGSGKVVFLQPIMQNKIGKYESVCIDGVKRCMSTRTHAFESRGCIFSPSFVMMQSAQQPALCGRQCHRGLELLRCQKTKTELLCKAGVCRLQKQGLSFFCSFGNKGSKRSPGLACVNEQTSRYVHQRAARGRLVKCP